MEDSKFRCKKMAEEDLEMIMNWRMQEDVTRFMYTDPILDIKLQKEWFAGLGELSDFYWVIYVDEIPCGMIYLANYNKVCAHSSWGYYVANKSINSYDLMISLEMSLYDYAFDVLSLNKIYAKTFSRNIDYIRLHELSGCKTEGVFKSHVLKNDVYYDVCVQSIFRKKWLSIRNEYEYLKIKFE